MNSELIISSLKENISQAYALHKIITDDEGKPIDYQFVDANKRFEKFTGLKVNDVIGKTVLQVLPGIESSEFDWISEYGEVAIYGNEKEFTQYSEPLGKWYKIKAFSPGKNYFVTLFEVLDLGDELVQNIIDLKILLDNIQTQVWYLTDDHTYGSVNKAHAEFNGVKPEDLAFKDMYDIFPKDIVDMCRVGNIEVFQTGKTIHSEEWVPHSSGGTRLISIVKVPKHNNNGDVEYVVCSAEDITDSKRAEEKLMESNQLLESIYDNTHIMVCYLDSAFNFIRVNKAYAMADEKDVSYYVGKNHFELFPNDENKKIFEGVIRTGKPHFETAKSFEYGNNPERSVSYWDWSLVPIKDSTGVIKGLIMTLLNVTESIERRCELESSLANFKLLFENSPLGIYIADVHGNILDANQTLLDILGSPSVEATKQINVLEFPPLVKNGYANTFMECVISGKTQRIELEYTSRWDKKLFTLLIWCHLKTTGTK